MPFIDSKLTLPNKKILYNLPASNVLTKDKKDMVIDNYVIWQISDQWNLSVNRLYIGSGKTD